MRRRKKKKRIALTNLIFTIHKSFDWQQNLCLLLFWFTLIGALDSYIGARLKAYFCKNRAIEFLTTPTNRFSSLRRFRICNFILGPKTRPRWCRPLLVEQAVHCRVLKSDQGPAFKFSYCIYVLSSVTAGGRDPFVDCLAQEERKRHGRHCRSDRQCPSRG
jgi:hypothetical protein